MKAVRALLLILALVVGHTHVCHVIWRLPSGQVCEACPQTEVRDHHEGGRPRETIAANDCRDCCSLTHCDDDGPDATKAFSVPATLVMARIEPELVLPSLPIITRDPIAAVVALHLPNAPPSLRSARAPPFLLA
jgi:hypothetical protein